MYSAVLPLVIGCLVTNVVSQNDAECSENQQGVPPGPKKGNRDIVDCFSTTQEQPSRNHWTCDEGCSEQTTETPYQCPSAVPSGGQQSNSLQIFDPNHGCESGFPEFGFDNGLMCEDPLLDGHDCNEGDSCFDHYGCFHGEVLPSWDDTSMTLCGDQDMNNADIISDQLQAWGDTPFENDQCF